MVKASKDDNRPYKCATCGKKFRGASGLWYHNKQTHGYKPKSRGNNKTRPKTTRPKRQRTRRCRIVNSGGGSKLVDIPSDMVCRANLDDDDSKADADEARDATRDAQKSLEMPLGTDEDKPPPSEIPDPNASKPEEWDDEEDGEWEHPTVHNPEHDDWVAGADKRKDDLRHASDRRRHFADSVREEVLRFRLVERADDGTPDERIKRLRLWRIWPYANDDAACPEFTDSQYTYKLCLFGEVKQDSTLLGKMDDGEMLGLGGLDDNAASATTPTLGVLAEALDAVIPAAAAAASAKGTGAGDRLTSNFRHGDSGFFCGSEGRRLSATVTCGAEPTLKAVTEPERCSYQAEVAIPAMCLGSSPTTTHDEL